MDVSVVIATYGNVEWTRLADRAAKSVVPLETPIIRVHGDTLHGARNDGLAQVKTEWVCFLDADDELEPGYFTAMERGTCDMRAPAVRYVRRGRQGTPPRVPRVSGHSHKCAGPCLEFGNWLVIGTVVRTDLVRQVGGFDDHSWSEDWCLWSRCWQAGATIEAVPAAIYRAHVRVGSRNRAPKPLEKLEAHREIARERGFPVP